MQPVTSLRVKSVIAAPSDGVEVVVGTPLVIRGAAWSGDAGPVTRIDVSVDRGRTWAAARVPRSQRTTFGWRQWEFQWIPTRVGYHTIMSRARDSAGNIQPLDQEWNPSGYVWNVVPRLGVDVVTRLSDTPRPTPSPAPAAAPPAAFTNACTVCHDEDLVRQQRLTRAQWDGEINKMIGWGARVAADDRATLLDYLSSHYGPRTR
jgi:hypothetical protein